MTPALLPLARLGTAGAVGLGALVLAGCAAGADAGADTGGEVDTSASYADGDYAASGSYVAPSGQEHVEVELTLEGDIVTAITVTPTATDPQASGFQQQFAGGIAELVVGRDIDTLDVSRVAGSSLTSGGFRSAIDAIKAEALEP